MKTKEQKNKQIEEGIEILDKNSTLIFADFTGTPTSEINLLRKSLRNLGVKFQIFKKRLFKIIFSKKGLDFNPGKFEGQLGVIAAQKNLEETILPVYKFIKEKQTFKILGGFDIDNKKEIDADYIKMIGQLPAREILLAQLVGMIAAPIRKFLFALNVVSKRSG